MTLAFPALAAILALLLVSNTTDPAWLVLPVNVLVFFVAAMVCHGELAADRPSTEHLTTFYLLMSVGGVLGGVFNALVAPLVFDGVAEYPIALVLACLLCPARDARAAQRPRLPDLLLAAIPAALVLALPLVLGPLTEAVGLATRRFDHLRTVLVVGIPLVVCYLMVKRPARFALALGAWFLAGDLVYERSRGALLIAERSFFGVHRVSYQKEYDAHLLRHGLTAHGMQKLDPGLRHIPTAYFHYTGPAGQVFMAYEETARRVALIGLGAGTLAAYTLPGRHFTYFEIDPTVVRIAEDTSLFTYLADARIEGATVDVRLGDARLTLDDEPDGEFDLLLVDAFSSASIPMHLLTREALALYLSKVKADGLLLFHVSNNYLDIAGALAQLAADAGLAALHQDNQVESDRERAEGKLASQWVVMARDPEHLARLPRHPNRWQALPPRDGRAVWTDDFSNIVTMLKRSAPREKW
jgi:spermidine synthase